MRACARHNRKDEAWGDYDAKSIQKILRMERRRLRIWYAVRKAKDEAVSQVGLRTDFVNLQDKMQKKRYNSCKFRKSCPKNLQDSLTSMPG